MTSGAYMLVILMAAPTRQRSHPSLGGVTQLSLAMSAAALEVVQVLDSGDDDDLECSTAVWPGDTPRSWMSLSSGGDGDLELQYCRRPLEGLQGRIEAASNCQQVSFDLGPSPGNELLQHAHGRVLEVIDRYLSRRRRASFKIGITFQPLQRWAHPGYGYKHKGYKQIIFCFATDRSDDVASLERALIASFKFNTQCRNVSPGGESAHHGFSPFFLYVAFA